MSTHCLICNSSAVMSKDTANALSLLIGTLDGFLRGVRHARALPLTPGSDTDSPLGQVMNLVINSLPAAVSGWADSTEFIKDVQKYQFMHHGYLCLRCGALFDNPTAT